MAMWRWTWVCGGAHGFVEVVSIDSQGSLPKGMSDDERAEKCTIMVISGV